jgi:hypothetical protein
MTLPEEATDCSICGCCDCLEYPTPPRIVRGKSQWTRHWTPRSRTRLGYFICDICGAKFSWDDFCGEGSKCPKCGSSQYADVTPPEKEVVRA